LQARDFSLIAGNSIFLIPRDPNNGQAIWRFTWWGGRESVNRTWFS